MMPSLNRKMRSIVCKQERQGSSYDGDVEIENYKSGLVSNFSFETSETIKLLTILRFWIINLTNPSDFELFGCF